MEYCEKCRDFHEENDICPKYKEQLKKHPEWLAEVSDFANVAVQERLVATQALDKVFQGLNKIANTNFRFEGSLQAARDIQVFSKLNTDSFRHTEYFANAQTAQSIYEQSGEGFKRYLNGRLNGTGQEVDWLRSQRGKISGLLKKSSLPNGNTPGYDGEIVNRFTGKTIERVSVKAAESSAGLRTNANDIVEAIKKGTLKTNDTIYGINGIKDKTFTMLDKAIEEAKQNGDLNLVNKFEQAKDNLKFTENGNYDSVKDSTKRLTEKIKNGNATPEITGQQVAQKATQGAVIGAAFSLTISGIINFIKYKNGEITREEAFRDVGEDTIKGCVTGGAMGAITLFLPGGVIGFIGGVAIGMYISEVTGNFLDEIFGKGAYEQILNACGYVAGTAENMTELLEQYAESVKKMATAKDISRTKIREISVKEVKNKKSLNELNEILEDL